MSEKSRKSAEELEKDGLRQKNLNKLKILDGMTAYIVSLLLFACAYGFLTKYIGVWALFGTCALSIISVMVLIKLTGLKLGSVLKFSSPKKMETIGCALSLASAFMLSMPLILFSHLIAPRLAATSFNIYSIVGKSGTFVVILLVLLIAVCENILFDGYIYSRFKAIKSSLIRAVSISLMAAVLRFDLYVVTTVFIMSLAAVFVRKATDNMSLALVIRICLASFVMAMSSASANAAELIGESMGVVQVIGLSLIFVGTALPAIAGALGAFGRLEGKGRLVGFLSGVSAILLVAAGCGISSL